MPRVISPDDYRYLDGKYTFRKNREPYVWGRAYLDLVDLLKNGQGCETLTVMAGLPGSGKTTWIQEHGEGSTIYFDATSLTPERRAPVTALGAALGAYVTAVYLNTPLHVCKERNDCREEGRRVPDEIMDAMHQKITIPALEEGFRVVETFL
jgi:predicted kinase